MRGLGLEAAKKHSAKAVTCALTCEIRVMIAIEKTLGDHELSHKI